MEKFIYLFKGGESNGSEDAIKADMQKWMAYMGNLGQNGHLVGGEPIQPGGKNVKGTQKTVTDVTSKEAVNGYLIVNAKDINEAVELSKGCPILESNGEIEIRQIQKIEM
ncbi:MAG: hypothetical protein H0W61_09520 [Bacteroidetes bacterium]|nr:hypothetical protein [Bacteroidota bacterium]